MNKVYLIQLLNDDIEPMVVGIATNKEKANWCQNINSTSQNENSL